MEKRSSSVELLLCSEQILRSSLSVEPVQTINCMSFTPSTEFPLTHAFPYSSDQMYFVATEEKKQFSVSTV